MINIEQSKYGKRLAKMALWPIAGSIILIISVVTIQALMLYWKFIPDMLVPFEHVIEGEQLYVLKDGIHKILINLGTWIFISMVLNLMFIYFAWNARKFMDECKLSSY